VTVLANVTVSIVSGALTIPDVAKTNGLRVLQPRKLTLANSGTVVRGINALEVFGYKVRLFLL
jgi:hypothetical protein